MKEIKTNDFVFSKEIEIFKRIIEPLMKLKDINRKKSAILFIREFADLDKNTSQYSYNCYVIILLIFF